MADYLDWANLLLSSQTFLFSGVQGASRADADAAMETQKAAAAAIYETVLTLSSAGVEPAAALTGVMAALLQAPDVLDASTREHCAVLLREAGGAPKVAPQGGGGAAGGGAGGAAPGPRVCEPEATDVLSRSTIASSRPPLSAFSAFI